MDKDKDRDINKYRDRNIILNKEKEKERDKDTKRERDRTKLALLASVGYCTIFGFSFMQSRIALSHTTPDMLLAIRFMVSMLAMLLLAVTGLFRMDLKGKPVGMFLVMGLCQPVIYFFGETAGIQYTNSSFAGIMIALIPVVTVLMSAVFLHERISLRTFGWVLCSVAGAFIISMVQTGNGSVQLKGIMFLMVAVISAVVFYLLSRTVAQYFTPFERTFIMMVMGFVCFTLSAVVREGDQFMPLLRAGLTDKYVMLPILYLALLSSVAAFMLQNYAITYLSVAQCTVFENIIPVVSVAAGVIFLGEPFSFIQLVGMALILLGVWKVSTSKDSASSE